MIDMHCHILPGIDDGARTPEDSMKLLLAEKEQGIDRIVFTPHYNPERVSLDAFLSFRAESFERLKNTEGFSRLSIETKLGAEVFFSIRLMDMDISKLCFEDTAYMLLELPTNVRPYGLKHTLQSIMDRGITPILAHVERYDFFTHDPASLYDLVMLGCAAQVNAGAVTNGATVNGVCALQYINWELAQIICSDAHSVDTRPPNTRTAYEFVKKKLGVHYLEWLQKNSLSIFNDKLLEIPEANKPKKLLGRWR